MEDNYTYEELALGYANRSAVLFQMKEYELCIRDITRYYLQFTGCPPFLIKFLNNSVSFEGTQILDLISVQESFLLL